MDGNHVRCLVHRPLVISHLAGFFLRGVEGVIGFDQQVGVAFPVKIGFDNVNFSFRSARRLAALRSDAKPGIVGKYAVAPVG